MKQGSTGVLIIYIAATALSAAATTLFSMIEVYELAVVAALCLCFFVYKLVDLYIDSARKIAFMFNAIDCDDYNFRFTTSGTSLNNEMLNASLNRIKEIMTNAKIRAAEREKYYELIMSSVRTGIITINDNGNVYQINSEAYRIFGISLLTHVNQLATINDKLPACLQQIKAGERHQIAIRNERGEVTLTITASEMVYDGKHLRIVALNDINNELDEMQVESWIRLTRVLTHEIMNSLAPITSLSETLIAINKDMDKEVAMGLETISTTGKSLIAFVDSYRKFTRMQTPSPCPIPLKQLVEKVKSLISDEEVKVLVEIDPVDTMIYADEDMINQVLVNLLKNGIHAALQSQLKEVRICSYITKEENICISITNSGPAIPTQIVDDIFMPFFTTKKDGSGIGLSVSKQIMHLHNGSIKLTSNQDGKVTFTLMFA